MDVGRTRRGGKLAGLIRNPVVIAALIFLLNVVLSNIIAVALTLLNIKNSSIITFGGLMAAYVIGIIHAATVKEPMPKRTKIIATVLYTLAGIAVTVITLIAAGLSIIQQPALTISIGLSIVYAVVIYFFMGLGEKPILRATQKRS